MDLILFVLISVVFFVITVCGRFPFSVGSRDYQYPAGDTKPRTSAQTAVTAVEMAIPRDIQLEVDALVLRLRRRQLVGSHSVALATALLMRHVVSRWGHTQTLICGVKAVGRHLVSAMPSGASLTGLGFRGHGSRVYSCRDFTLEP